MCDMEIIKLPYINSTNTYAKDNAQSFSKKITVIQAERQLQGRGRLGRDFLSDNSDGAWFSVVIKPEKDTITPRTVLLMPILAAGETAAAIEDIYGIKAGIKWPNDIYINNKKVAGLLLENAIQGNSIKYSIAGMGINVNQQIFSTDKATSLSTQTNHKYVLIDLLNELLSNINNRYGQLKLKQWPAIFNEYHKHLLGLNKLLTFKTQNQQFEGTILGVNTNGQLQVKRGDEILNFGVKEISML